MRTERALQQAALELFGKQGYDTTTTDEIAERAGVSPRTFFRYFPTKESVLFVGEQSWLQSLTKQFLTQPRSLNEVEALRDALVELAPRLAPGRRSLLLYEKAVASSPTLRGRVHDNVHREVTELAEAIAVRRQLAEANESCALLAAIVLMTYRRALTRWLAGPARTDFRDVISDEFQLLIDQFQALGLNGRRRAVARRAAVAGS